MTTENNAEPKTDKKAKKKKPKGPIRWEAIVPFTLVAALLWAYFFFFFDLHVKNALEFVGTRMNGAEVNIGRLHTSFWSASLELNKIQITDLDEPAKNKIQIGEVRWKMLWDALLRGKVAIEDASILEIAIGVPRARPGRVLPPPPPGAKSAFDKVREQALAKAQEEFSKNVLGDVAAILGGVDPAQQLKDIGNELKSSVRVKALQDELALKEKEWRERIDRLPQAKDLQSLQTRLKAVKVDGFSNPAEVQASIQQLDSIFKEADAKYKEVQSTSQALGSDTNTYKNALSELDAMVRQDIKDLESRLKIPKLDVESLSKSIFGPLFLNRVKQAEYYMMKARDYMPPQKTAEEKAAFKAPIPRERHEGRNYKFGRPNSYPLFWLKNAAISSKATPGADWSGNLVGSLKNVTDDPPTLGRPTTAQFKGDFPKQELMGVDGLVTIDHVTDRPVEKLNLKVASYPVIGQKLVESPDVNLGFNQAQASTELNATLAGGEIDLSINGAFQKKGPGPNVDPSGGGQVPSSFLVAEAKQPILNDILKGAFADIPRVTLNAAVKGPWDALRFNINSNLGSELQRAFDKQIQIKIAEARAKLQALVDEQVGKQKERLNAEYAKIKSQLDSVVKSKQDEINKFKNSIETAKNDALKNQSKRLENEGKKALDQLKGKLKF